MHYHKEVLVRFAHCDPAGIVFYPRYFEMTNGIVEDWFEEGLEISFSGLLHHRQLVTPTVHFDVDFVQPSNMGDRITFRLCVTKIGKSSFDLDIQVSCQGEIRLNIKQTLVFTDPHAKSTVPIPPDIIKRMTLFMVPTE